jgi:polyadenylate-binding protein
MAFACYNTASLDAYASKLELHVRDPNGNVPEPTSDSLILHVKLLPSHYNSISLYQLFRTYGPLHSARMMYDKTGQIKNQANVQYYYQEHAQAAQKSLHSKELIPGTGRLLQISPLQMRNKNQNNPNNPRNSLPKLNSTPHGFGGSGGGGAMSPAPPSPGVEGPFVDPCNLFIKNLDANISSSDLFNHFRKYGRIISARVMRDQQTGNSKGFGFVSYTSAEEADRAKSSMNGKTLGTKQIVVRLHEPKKLREAKLATHFSGDPLSPSDSRPPSRRNSDIYPVNAVNEFDQEALSGLAPKARKEVLMSELQKRFKLNIPSVPADEVNPIIEILVRNKVPEVLHMLKDPAVLQQKVNVQKI